MSTTTIKWEKDSDNIVTLTIDDPSQSANTLNEQFMTDLATTVERLEADKDSIAGVIITSGKSMFFAGADIHGLFELTEEQVPQFEQACIDFKSLLRRLEMLQKPVVAAINGTALGGGFEIALATHHRIAINNPKAEIGLPEVMLGLLPGGGGVVRTVRLLGLQEALMQVLLQGARMKPEKAKRVGIIDEVVDDADEMMAKARAFIAENPKALQPWDQSGYKMPGGTPKTPKLAMNLPAFPANLMKQIKGANYPAPKAIMSAAVEGAQVDFDNAMDIETRYFVHLAKSPVAKNMIKALFLDLQGIKKGGSRPSKDEYPVWKASKIGVLGAGMMGHGITYSSAYKGIEVVLLDRSLEDAKRGKEAVEALLNKRVKKRRMTEERRDEILGRITATDNYEDLKGCEMVIEAVFEDRAIKATVTQATEAVIADDAVMASNTSTLPITGLAEASVRPENYIGLHFFSPVDKMPLVEIICGEKTSDAALAKSLDYVLQIGKTPIVVNDSRGFYTSRTIGAYANEGIEMLVEGYNPVSIEQAAAQAGMPVGPLTIMDEVNIGLARKIQIQTEKDLAAEGKKIPDNASTKVFPRMVEEFNRPGKKEGAGFYDYPQDGKKKLWPGLWEHFVKPEHEKPSAEDFQEMQERLLYMFSLETVRCFEENVLTNVPDANIGGIFGIGAPPWTGGPLQYINYVGLQAFVDRAKELAAKYGERFEPPSGLVERAQKGETYQ